jgi:hypothetical protein
VAAGVPLLVGLAGAAAAHLIASVTSSTLSPSRPAIACSPTLLKHRKCYASGYGLVTGTEDGAEREHR